jgi:acylphosphatase
MNKRVVLKIYGRVQNVFFRDSARRQAKKLGLTGYVRNQEDGSVMITAEGEKEKLKKLIDWCYNGPILANVEKIDINWQKAIGQFKKFEIRY